MDTPKCKLFKDDKEGNVYIETECKHIKNILTTQNLDI